ncbi:class I SAM-dependent RNA methyltransferase [Angustibacter sp. McL0619]|uniref:class I SAM-dependent RNA methyltransferase n=1 Tax=Angustibacter sp. McL0619 TaxID=3415676 RepID=UPI003CE9676F
MAHGGHCVARHEGRVVFVRHALPGERARVLVTEGAATDRFLRGDAVEILVPAPDRVPSRCPVSGPGGCGGCDWQHVSVDGQRSLKADVVREQLHRLAGLDGPLVDDLVVEQVPGDDDGLGWRTRVQHSVSPRGRLGLREHRSHQVVEIERCPIAAPRVQEVELGSPLWPGAARVEVVAPAGGDKPLVLVEPVGRRPAVLPPGSALDASVATTTRDGLERVRGRTWVREQVDVGDWHATMRVSGSGFWQVHPGAPAALVGAVLELLDPAPGEQALDLFSGVGLFAAALAARLGPDGAVLAVEGDPHAVRDARRNLHELTQVGITAGRVDRVLATMLDTGLTTDLVVLDPPREGAGRRVVEQVVAVEPRAVAYVACDPAALARDVRTFAEHGYELDALRAFDCFPMTHHIECVARLVPAVP